MTPSLIPKLEPGEATSSPDMSCRYSASHPSPKSLANCRAHVLICKAAIPEFPRYSTEPDPSMRISGIPRRSSTGRPLVDGPVPAPGTPQDRFAAVLRRSNSRVVPIMSMNTNMAYPNPPVLRTSAVNLPMTGSSGARYASQPANQPVPSLSASTQPTLPTHPAADTSMESNSNNGIGGRGPALPGPTSSSTQWLSYECQRRHFNPMFKIKESRTRAGEVRYQCTVILKDIVVQSSSQFHNPVDAKMNVAEKALRQVRREWPTSGPNKGREHSPTTTTSNPHVSDTVHRQEELRWQLMRRHKTKNAEIPQPSPLEASGVDMSDPTQARAFVEGFKIGQMAAQRAAGRNGSSVSSIKESQTQRRTRSQSPAIQDGSSHSNGGRRYRYRSPLRGSSKVNCDSASPPRYYDGGRHDPRLPSTDRYRPCHPDVEDTHGRLHESDEAHQGH